MVRQARLGVATLGPARQVRLKGDGQMRTPEYEEKWYQASRFWTYRANNWDPAWWHKLGVPYLAGDEWGRRTIVWGVGFLGYVVWAWRTCWCQECHAAREQTYRFEMERYNEYRDKLDRGQCVCFNKLVSRYWLDKELHPHQARPVLLMNQKCLGKDCGHLLSEHDKYGECMHLNSSMSPTEKDPAENLEIGSSRGLDVRPVTQPDD